MSRNPLLAALLVSFLFIGAGCQTVRPVPPAAKTLFAQYLTAMRSSDFDVIRQSLCATINRDQIIQIYQHTFESDRIKIADAFQNASPSNTDSSETRLVFSTDVDLSTGYTNRRIDLNLIGTQWCISE